MQLPWGLAAIFISLFLFYYFSQKNKIRKKEQRERLREARKEFLNSLIKSSENEKDAKEL